MKRIRYLLAAIAFLLPITLRGFWFYEGIYRPRAPISIPDYTELKLPSYPVGDTVSSGEEAAAAGKVILLDWAHDNQFEISELEEFISSLASEGARVEIIQGTFATNGFSLYERLKYASAYLIVAPGVAFSKSEVQNVSRFVERGGRLVVISDPTRGPSGISSLDFEFSFGYSFGAVESANSILAPFDLTFSDDYLYNLLENEGNFRNVLFHKFADDPVTEDLSTVAFYGVRSVMTNTGTPLILGDRNTLSSRTDRSGEWSPAARSQVGGVIALGDLTFLTPPYNQISDNPRLISQLASFLLGGERRRDLTGFPFLFDRQVAILRTDFFALAAETLRPVSRLQDSLEAQGLTLSLVDEPSPGQDMIIFDSYSPSEDVKPFLKQIDGLTLPGETEDGKLTVPGFGEVDPTGIGLFLLSPTEVRTALIVLADTSDEILTMMDMLADIDLSACLVREQVALCKVGAGAGLDFGGAIEEESFEFDDLYLENYSTEEPSLPTPMPTVTP